MGTYLPSLHDSPSGVLYKRHTPIRTSSSSEYLSVFSRSSTPRRRPVQLSIMHPTSRLFTMQTYKEKAQATPMEYEKGGYVLLHA